MLTVRESLLKELGTVVDDLVIEQVIRTDIGEKYLAVICKAASDYTREIFHKLREREYNPDFGVSVVYNNWSDFSSILLKEYRLTKNSGTIFQNFAFYPVFLELQFWEILSESVFRSICL